MILDCALFVLVDQCFLAYGCGETGRCTSAKFGDLLWTYIQNSDINNQLFESFHICIYIRSIQIKKSLQDLLSNERFLCRAEGLLFSWAWIQLLNSYCGEKRQLPPKWKEIKAWSKAQKLGNSSENGWFNQSFYSMLLLALVSNIFPLSKISSVKYSSCSNKDLPVRILGEVLSWRRNGSEWILVSAMEWINSSCGRNSCLHCRPLSGQTQNS